MSTLVENLPTDIVEIEGARSSVLSDADAFKKFEDAFYGSLPEALKEGTPSAAAGADEGSRLRAGIGRYILGQDFRTATVLDGVEHDVARYLRARIHLELDQASLALAEIGPVAEKQSKVLPVRMAQFEAQAQCQKLDEAAGTLEQIRGEHADSPDVPYADGFLAELSGDYESAHRLYQQALALDSAHTSALFRLAYSEALRGEPETAIELYERLCNTSPAPVGALINLGLLFEDEEDYQLAASCFQKVLDFDPNNRKARLYYRDAAESTGMYYDEERERKEDKRAQILRIPVTDFELSVRSRNCLANMNVRTLGDLIRLTEQELLSFKNFGETSLLEIKHILNQKGLRLGMMPRDEAAPVAPVPVGQGEDAMNLTVAELDLSVRSRKALETLQIRTVRDLTLVSEARLLACKNFGQTSLAEIKKKLTDLGLALKAS